MAELRQANISNALDDFSIAPPAYVDVRVLGSAGTPESHTIPAGATKVVFSANGDFYASTTETAAVPTVDVTDGSGSFLNPATWHFDPNNDTAISLVAPSAGTKVTMAFYK